MDCRSWMRQAMRLVLVSGLILPVAAAKAAEMGFRLVQVGNPAKCGEKCLQIIAADGEISDTTPERFIEFVKSHSEDSRVRSVILFNSPGGKVVASLKLGYILRKIGAATIVARALGGEGDGLGGMAAGRCYSACVYAIMGGVKRMIPLESEIGIHRSSISRYGDEPKRENIDAQPRIDPDLDLRIIGRYSETMGVSKGLVAEAQRTNPNSIHIVTRAEISRWRLGAAKF